MRVRVLGVLGVVWGRACGSRQKKRRGGKKRISAA